MNRKNLTAAVLAGLAGAAGIVGSAQAVNINPDGLGQVLIYPYYTTNGGNQTVLSVVNTSEEAKAVKVRFLEGQNSREVLDFNLYMSAYDVWTAALYDDAGTPTLITTDTSCTVPYLYAAGGVQPFLPWALTDTIHQEDDDEYGDISRGSEGHFEMIEMAMITNESTYTNPDYDDTDPDSEPTLSYNTAKAVTHSDGVPANCDQLVGAWTRDGGGDPDDHGYWIQDNLIDTSAPSGGLFGGAAIVDVAKGTMYSYDAKAINGFATQVAAVDPLLDDDMHQEPGTILPSLDSGGVMTATVFADDGTLLPATSLARGVDAVSYVFMHDQIMNEYTTEAAVNAGTEWVITFPTKQFYVHQDFLDAFADFRETVPAYDVELDASGNPTDVMLPMAPFTDTWVWVETTYNEDDTVKKAGYVDYPCEYVEFDIYDREEGVPGADPDGPDIPPIVSPRPPTVDPTAKPGFPLCYETQVVRFGAAGDDVTIDEDGTEILGSNNFTNIDNTLLDFEYGWVNMDFVNFKEDSLSDLEARTPLGGLFGLPVTGFAVQAFENGFLGEGADTLANYGGIFTHKGTRSAATTAQ